MDEYGEGRAAGQATLVFKALHDYHELISSVTRVSFLLHRAKLLSGKLRQCPVLLAAGRWC